jgi:spore coat polysaccharide biosynthesis protein SpsF
MKKEIIGLVAVRTASSRLNNKAFRIVNNKPLIAVLVDRLEKTEYLDGFIVCTTTLPGDDAIEEFCNKKGVMCHRGEVENVMGRFLGAAEKMPSEYLVRITGDNPLTDFDNMKLSFEYMKANDGDYSRPVGLPLGTACEIIRSDSLKELNRRTVSHDLTEYMTWFFEMAPFVKKTLYEVEEKYRLPDLRLTVDYESDIIFIESIFKEFNGDIKSLDSIVSYCKMLDDYPKVVNDIELMEKIKSKIKFI